MAKKAEEEVEAGQAKAVSGRLVCMPAVKTWIRDLNISHCISATCIVKCIKDIHSPF